MKAKPHALIAVLSLTILLFSCKPSESIKESVNPQTKQEFYQLKIYSFDSLSQVATTEEYLEKAYLPALKKLGFKNTGVFKSKLDTTNTIPKLYVLLNFTTMDQWLTIEDQLKTDIDYQDGGSQYIKSSYLKPPFSRIESVLMKAFNDMPLLKVTPLKSERSDRVYELRSYEGPTEDYYRRKVQMFNEGGEIKLFDKLGFNPVFFAEVISGSKMPNLVYMTTFENQIKRDSLWNEFVNAPEWIGMKDIPKYKNTVSHADILFLKPTNYSDY